MPDDWAEDHELSSSTMEALREIQVQSEYDVARLKWPQLKNLKIVAEQKQLLFIIARNLSLKLGLYR